ncbi:hypothetical protein GGR54DRAFT_257648 [Hypoxylon sp. NC1633]|nr:hypothetical protein GGR54DRAFT_257648 [Hypoxylon sp. NC1633]
MTVSPANIEAMMGSKILKLNPTLIEDFWAAKAFAPEYFQGWPRWLAPKIFRARDRVIDAIRKWHEYAFAHGDHTNTGPRDPDWDSVWGSKYAKVRQQFMLKMTPLTPYVRAAEDWGLMFGANGNTAPVVFWFLFETLKDPGLASRMMAEVRPTVSERGDVNA